VSAGAQQRTWSIRLPPKRRAISKATIIGVLFAMVMLGVILYETLRLEQSECQVCMQFEGREKCLTVQAEDEQQAVQTARDNACSFITIGRAESFRCTQSPPASIQCRPL
jgi:hypothetical protein